MPTAATAENPYPAYFKEIYDAQEARKQSLETRAAAIIGVSGAVVSAVLALAALSTQSADTFSLTKDGRWYIYAALVALVISSIIAIVAAVPLFYHAVLPAGLKWIVEAKWNEPPGEAALRIGVARAQILRTNKRLNDFKALLLMAALGAQIAAIVFLMLAAWDILSVAQLAPSTG